MGIYEDAAAMHRKAKGKIEVVGKVPLVTREDLALAYTPGVAEPCRIIAANPEEAYNYTIKGNTIAVVSDGSAVLGLGNIGAKAAIPVMEGKAALFKRFAGINAFPICIATQDPEEIVSIVKNIAPVFGGINLEDISAPRCFEIERELQDIGIPVMHDDQHGTAIVVRAALMNAAKVVGKPFTSFKVVISGAGAAGTGIANLLICHGSDALVCESVADVVVCDSKGIIHSERSDLNEAKKELASNTNSSDRLGSLKDALHGADVFIGVSASGLLSKEMIATMAPKPIILAMANPEPEIMPADAHAAGAAIVGTGRSDFPNQVNNVLAFPGVFKGALDAKATVITSGMMLAASAALAECVEPKADSILPSPFQSGVAEKVAAAVARKAREEKVVRDQG